MRKSNTPFLVAIVSLSIVGVCAIGVAVGFGLGAFGGQGVSSKAAPVASQLAQEQSSASNAVSDASASASASKSDAAVKKEASSSSASKSAISADSKESSKSPESSSKHAVTVSQRAEPINLKNTEDYYDVNLFLSNFAEWREFYNNGQSFDRDEINMRQLVNWAMWHNAINNKSTLDTHSVEVTGAPASEMSKGLTGIKPETYPRNMSTDLIKSTIKDYIGVEVELANYNSGDGAYYEHGGRMYEGLYRGDAAPCDNIALADSVHAIGDSYVRVDFTIYSGNHSLSVVSDKSWYGMSGSGLTAAMRAAGSTNVTTQPASAFIEIVNTDDGKTFKLVSFELADTHTATRANAL